MTSRISLRCTAALILAGFPSAAPLLAQAPQSTEASRMKSLKSAGYIEADTLFAKPVIDTDEVRENNGVSYRYVHGGFEGTATRFSYYFPVKWQGRFFQYITPVPDSETLSQGLKGSEDRIGSAFASGAYFIETNGGGPGGADPRRGPDPSIGAYRANAAAARFSRFIAAQVYGARAHVYGYAYGGSGGAYRTLGSLENTKGVWDGAVPYVLGSPMAIPNMFTVRLHAMRVLGDKLDGVVDALDAGGSGDPYAQLEEQQRSALKEATAMGFPPQSWYAWRTMGPHAFALLFGAVRTVDASYFDDFWTKPGYEGRDHPDQYAQARIQFPTTVAEVITASEAERAGLPLERSLGTAKGTADLAWQAMGLSSAGQLPVAVRLARRPPSGALLLADLVLPDGRKLLLSDVKGDLAIIGINDPRVVGSVKSGMAVRVDNSDILAVQRYHAHQVPPNDGQYPAWDQFRDAQGGAKLPQRQMLLGPMFTRSASGAIPTGQFDGKVILIENLWDREALPWQGDWYRRQVAAKAGTDADNRFRIWFTDRALHGDSAQQDDPSRVVSYLGVLQQALRDLAAWVEDGKAPPTSTAYKVVDGQVVVPTGARERRGIQPVVSLTANGGAVARVKAGQAVRFSGTIMTPPGTGKIVAAEWDFEGDGTFEQPASFRSASNVRTSMSHAYVKPGTYFSVLRCASQREGDRQTPFARIENLARVRIVVE